MVFGIVLKLSHIVFYTRIFLLCICHLKHVSLVVCFSMCEKVAPDGAARNTYCKCIMRIDKIIIITKSNCYKQNNSKFVQIYLL